MRLIARTVVSHEEAIAVAAAATAAISFAVPPTVAFGPGQFVRPLFLALSVFDRLATGQLSQTDYPQANLETSAGAVILVSSPPAVINPLGPNGSNWLIQGMPDIMYHDFLNQVGGPAGPGLLVDLSAEVHNADAVNAHSVTLLVIGIFEIWEETRDEL